MISRRNSALALSSLALAAIFSVATPAIAQDAKVAKVDAPKVKITTSMGDIVVQLDPAKAPKTAANFV